MSAGVDPLRVSIEATAPSAPIYAGTPISLGFSDISQDALLFYWSAATNGVMRGGAARMTEREIQAVAQYAAGLR